MENPQVKQDDEIDLSEYANVIIKRGKFILFCFALAVISSVIYCLVTPRSYTATAIIMITPSPFPGILNSMNGGQEATVSNDTDKSDSTADIKTSLWDMSIAAHMKLLKSDLILERTIKKLGLKDDKGRDEAFEDFLKSIKTIKSLGESVIELEANGKNPQEARDIANTWGQQYVEYSEELISGEVNGIEDFVTSQFEAAQKNLLIAEMKVNDFKKDYKQDLMATDLSMKKEVLNNYKKDLTLIGAEEEANQEELRELNKQITSQKKFITLSKAITDDALWQASSQPNGLAGLESKELKSQYINPIYQDLEKNIINTQITVNTSRTREEYLKKSVDSLTEETKTLEDDITEKDYDLLQLTRQVEINKKLYNDLSKKIQQSRITKEAQLGEVKIVSPASAPNYPDRGRSKIVAIAGLLSLIFSILISFIIEFWQKCTGSNKKV